MVRFLGTSADLARQLYWSGPASVDGTLKRKRAGDDHGLSPTSRLYSEIAKRLKYRFHHDETTDTNREEQSSGYRSLHPYVCRPIHEHQTGTENFLLRTLNPRSAPQSQLILLHQIFSRSHHQRPKTPSAFRIASDISYTPQAIS